MNAVEKLFKIDEGKIKKIEKEITMKLKKLGNEEFTFIVREVDPEIISEFQEGLLEIDGSIAEISGTFNMKANLIAESCPDVFRNKELLKKFKCPTPIDFMKKIMTGGEIEKLYDFVQDVNGFTDDKKKKQKKK
ncbi:phage tail assembly chaperone [Clostridium tetani]|uniref:phage tail assembly chaperone n=1 Tax=Clostridium tetani TaxID=1513 RepID=UPI001027DA18|nr:hypothetical protein [Clostridium tetani]RXI70505.1 hypothetical protein DP127_09410 [Clostridium tetani]